MSEVPCISLWMTGLFCPNIGNSLSQSRSSMLHIVVSARPTYFFFVAFALLSTSVEKMVGSSSVVVYRSLLLAFIWESVVQGLEASFRPQSSERSLLDWEEGGLLHCALCGNCNHTVRGSKWLKAMKSLLSTVIVNKY